MFMINSRIRKNDDNDTTGRQRRNMTRNVVIPWTIITAIPIVVTLGSHLSGITERFVRSEITGAANDVQIAKLYAAVDSLKDAIAKQNARLFHVEQSHNRNYELLLEIMRHLRTKRKSTTPP